MIFDKLKILKSNRSTEIKPTKEEIDSSREKISMGVFKISYGPIETETIIPDYQDDYSKSIFLWANSKKNSIRNNDEYPRYILYECGIKNATEFHRQMVEEGFLERDSFESSLETLKVSDLKEIANSLGIGTSGKKADIISRIIATGKIDYLQRQMPITFSLSESGKRFVEQHDDCIQLHRNKNWLIDWNEFSKIKNKQANGTFYSVCNEIMLNRASSDKRLFGRIAYLDLSQLEKQYGDKNRALRYLLQVLYIDVSGVMLIDSLDFYKQGIYNKNDLKRMFVNHVSLAPGITEQIKKLGDFYDADILNRLYTWKLPIMICEKELFFDMVDSIFNGTFNTQYYSEHLKTRYDNYIDRL